MNAIDRKGDAFDRDVQRAVGAWIREACEPVVREPIDGRLARLLEELERREADETTRRAS